MWRTAAPRPPVYRSAQRRSRWARPQKCCWCPFWWASPTHSQTVKFVPTDTANYAEATGTVVVTINKATPTGAPKYTAISASGKTLADAGLTTPFWWASPTHSQTGAGWTDRRFSPRRTCRRYLPRSCRYSWPWQCLASPWPSAGYEQGQNRHHQCARDQLHQL